MKRLVLVLVLALSCSGAYAMLSCDEVNELGEALTGVGIALDEGLEVGVGGEVEAALAEITLGLAEIAGAEGDEDLAAAAIAMGHAWDAEDQEAFTDALAVAVAKLAIIATTECEY